MEIRTDIFEKILAFDYDNGTNFATIIQNKVNKAHDAYTRGIVHGLCLALAQANAISNFDAMDILDLVQVEEEEA